MLKTSPHTAALAFLIASAAFPLYATACVTCGCSLSTDAAQGFSNETGWRASLQYDFINQNQLRSGRHEISSSTVAAINNAGGDQEVERGTVNRYITMGLSYSPNPDWNARLLVPYVDRGHATYGTSRNPLSSDERSGVNLTALGDVRLIGTWQGLLPAKNLGIQFGVKLPTGDFGGPNATGTGIVGRHPRSFTSGPASSSASPGNLVDTSLQPGNGSTDAIAGAFYRESIFTEIEAFGSVQFQASFANRLHQAGQDFRPGNTATATVGARFQVDSFVVPQLQINLSHKGADQGALADGADTAGTTAYLSPGATINIARNIQAFAFVQLPVYSNLAGIQLATRWTGSAGVSYAF